MRHGAVINAIKTGDFDNFTESLDITVGYVETSTRFPSKYDDRDGRYPAGTEIAKTSKLVITAYRQPDGWFEFKIQTYGDWTPTTEIDCVNGDEAFAALRERLDNGQNAHANVQTYLELQADLLEAGWEPSEKIGDAAFRAEYLANTTRQVRDALAKHSA